MGVHDDAWEDGFARLHSYVQREGHSRVPRGYLDSDGYRLDLWVGVQRQLYRRRTLKEDRARRLEELPGWTWSPFDDAWEDGFARLHSYVQREGHSRGSSVYRDDDGFHLGRWVQTQRLGYQQGTLGEDRARRLEALPGWTWNPYDDAWEDGFARLHSYAQKEGHSRVPARYRDGDGFALGQWVASQRQDRRGTLDEKRRRRLAALPGWTWNPYDDAWEDGFARLHSYVRREGHSRLPRRYLDGDGFQLGKWVTRQRGGYQRGTLEEERARRLEALQGWTWDPVDDAWEEGFAQLRSYAQTVGYR